MAVQWLGNIKPTGRGNLARDIGESLQPAVSAYSDYLAKTSEREKTQVNEFITNYKNLSVDEQDAVEIELQGKPKFKKILEEQVPWIIGESGNINLPANWEVLDTLGTQVILISGGKTKSVDMEEGIDFDKYDIVTMPDGSIVKENTRTGERTDVGEVKEIYSTSKTPITLDDGTTRSITTITFTDGSISEHITSAGVNAELKGLEMSIEANAEIAKLDRKLQAKWNTKAHQNKVDILEFEISEAGREQRNIERQEKSAQEKFDTQMKEDTRQFNVSTALAMYRESQTNERFDAELSHKIDLDLKKYNIDVKYKDAIMQDMKDKMSLAHDKYDLSKTTVAMDFVNTNIQLQQQGERLKIAQEESKWAIKSIKAEMNKYQSIGPVFAEDQTTIIGASGLRWDEEKGKYVEERLKNVPVSVARLMLEQQAWELEGNEQDNIIKAQGYTGLAAAVRGTIMNKKIPSINTSETWSSTAYMYAEKYAEGNEDVTPESAYGRILAHAYSMNWIDHEEVPFDSLLYTDEATTAFNDEQVKWAKENPLSVKEQETTPSTNLNPMSGGLQAMTPEDNQLKSLFNLLLGNDILYNNLKSAVTIPEKAKNLPSVPSDFGTIASVLSDLEKASGGGAGRRLDEYTKGVERRPTGLSPEPPWQDLLRLLGLGGGNGQ